jgi:hypothetical protein
MVVRRLVGIALMLLGGVALASPAPKPARPVRDEGPAEMWQPMTEAMERLGLTDLQRRILAQVFRQYTHERPAAPSAGAPLAVRVEPTAPGGLYRMGPGGDLPARLRVRVRAAGRPGAVRLRYVVQDFYGRKVAGANLPQVFPDAAGQAAADTPADSHVDRFPVLAGQCLAQDIVPGCAPRGRVDGRHGHGHHLCCGRCHVSSEPLSVFLGSVGPRTPQGQRNPFRAPVHDGP